MWVKAVIVDDEQPICDEIEYLLDKYIDIKIAGVFNNCIDALTYIIDNDCHLVFLDITMPGMSGLEMAQRLGIMRHPPLIVFITAFNEYALEAFDTPAVGYITKPVTEEQLDKILTKIRKLTAKITQQPKIITTKICVMKNGKIIPLDQQEIVFVYVKDKDVFVRTKLGEYSTMLSLQEIEKILSDPKFLRIHRQFIINLDKILEIIPWFHGTYMLRMDDFKSEEVPVSRNNTKLLKKVMGLK